MKTKHIRKHEPAWHIFDAEGKVLGRLCTEVSDLLRGKGKVEFVLNMDCGDHVVIINADKIVMTGNKLETKNYYRHSGHLGNLKTIAAKDLMVTGKADQIITTAVKGMLPKNKLQNEWMKRLHVYVGAEHPHKANTANLTTR
jgi:large subunit ribosomal protein L13